MEKRFMSLDLHAGKANVSGFKSKRNYWRGVCLRRCAAGSGLPIRLNLLMCKDSATSTIAQWDVERFAPQQRRRSDWRGSASGQGYICR
jgi:hypothetical protein